MKRNLAALSALIAGIALGILVRNAGNAFLTSIAHMLQPIGSLWLNALKMTLVPLVFAMVANGMISLDRSGGGSRLLAITLSLIIALLSLAVLLGMGIGLVSEALWPVAPGSLVLGASIAATAQQAVPSLADLLVALVPANPVAAASSGAMASIVVFAIFFGLAVARTSDDDAPLPRAIRGLADAMICIVHWVLRFAPLGIFILSFGLALEAGVAVAGFVARAIALTAFTAILAIFGGYALAIFGGGVAPRRFARAILGVQAMAAGTCSSAATLPAMIEASADKLEVPPAIGGAVLPLAVSIFRFAVPLHLGALLILVAHAVGRPLDPGLALLCGGVFILSNMGGAGLPGAAVLYTSWAAVLDLAGLPIAIIPLLIAANALPDIIVTVGNVTADLGLTTVVDRLMRRSGRAGVLADAPTAVAAAPLNR